MHSCLHTHRPTCGACTQGKTIGEILPSVVFDRHAMRNDSPVLAFKICGHLTGCKACRGSGIYTSADGSGSIMKRCDATSRAILAAERLTAARIPAAFMQAHVGRYAPKTEQAEAAARLLAWIEEVWKDRQRGRGQRTAKAGAWISGPSGTGKSSIAAILAARTAAYVIHPHDRDLSRQVRWSSARDLMTAERAHLRTRSTKLSPVGEAMACRLLVLDELDKVLTERTDSGVLLDRHDDDRIWTILRERHEQNLPTVVTSNMRASKWLLRSRNGAPLTSRLRTWLTVGMDGDDLRSMPPVGVACVRVTA